MPHALIALGSNLGKRQTALRAALAKIADLPTTTIDAVANFRITNPVGGPVDQPQYINAAATLTTQLPPRELLTALLDIERTLGRDRSISIPNGPRVIDLDLLLYDHQILDEPGLTIPHPRMHQRAFVLDPAAEIAPDWIHPTLHQSIATLHAALHQTPTAR
jgi:2-amino-4-hydroxy-6-hydroxymethyldihydropteridine diphosphokinase